MTSLLPHKVAIVTGGSRGIGKAIALRLASDGAQIVITYSQSPDAAEAVVKAITAKGGKAMAYKADAAQPETMPQLAKDVVKEFGKIDILVNNAGVFEGGMIGELDWAQYQRVMHVNIDSVVTLTNAAIPHMPDGGRIVNIGSCLGQRASTPGLGIYNASKAAVAMLSRSWAKDLGTRNILVNVVQPGPISTDMNPDNSEFADSQRANTVLGRYGKPEEVAGLVSFLAGPDSSYVTGAVLSVDGGWNA